MPDHLAKDKVDTGNFFGSSNWVTKFFQSKVIIKIVFLVVDITVFYYLFINASLFPLFFDEAQPVCFFVMLGQ